MSIRKMDPNPRVLFHCFPKLWFLFFFDIKIPFCTIFFFRVWTRILLEISLEWSSFIIYIIMLWSKWIFRWNYILMLLLLWWSCICRYYPFWHHHYLAVLLKWVYMRRYFNGHKTTESFIYPLRFSSERIYIYILSNTHIYAYIFEQMYYLVTFI